MKTICFFFCLCCLTSCFEIREEVNMKADGSGEVSVVFDLSESRDNLKKYMTMETVEGYKVPKKENIEAGLSQVKATLSAVPGISTVITKSDWSNFVFTVSGRFAHVQALNTSLETLAKEFDKQKLPAASQLNFSYNNSQFRRVFDYPAKAQEFRDLPSMQRYVLEKARMVSVYRFEKSIKGFSNKKAQLSPSGKAIMLKQSVAELAKGTGTLANTITF